MDNMMHANEGRVDSELPIRQFLVWDLPLRLFHWSMVGVVTVAGVTGFLAPAWWLDIHVIAGYALTVLLGFRLAWGFFGGYYSRFKTFPLSRDGVLGHLRQVLRKKSPVFTGHNPVGALMIVVLLLALVALVISGLVTLGGQEKLGPLAFLTSYKIGHFTKEIHESAAWIVVWAIAIHLLGVIVETHFFKHRVIQAMITGKKVLAGDAPAPGNLKGSARGLILSFIVPVVLIAGGVGLADKTPAGWRALQFPAAYSGECGECHDLYHPSLRSAQAWQGLMAGLPDHYGEDASLGKKASESIATFLTANNAATFDTEVARRMGYKNTPSLRMTDTRRWQKWHRDIDGAVFHLRAVGSKVNCTACHADALSGRFDDAKIHLPTGDQK